MNRGVWFHYFGNCDRDIHRTRLESLHRAAIRCFELDPSRPEGSGILFFDQYSDELRDLLRAVSHGGMERVLAAADHGARLDPIKIWSILRAGASDLILWNPLERPERHAAARFARWQEIDEIVDSQPVRAMVEGESATWKSILRDIVEVARYTTAAVLILGESGTGKEMVARLIHALNPSTVKGELVVLDCTTVMPELSGSEFYGHEKGAFTGATGTRDGAFARADGGTLFLDEVGELPPGLQAQLLRVVQERVYKRLGANSWQRTDFRLICATNRDLGESVCRGEFRGDLYYRLAGCVLSIPPLREHRGDILPLVKRFLRELHPDGEPPRLDEPVRDYLLRRDYPGNVRELKQLVARMSNRYAGSGAITMGDLPVEELWGQDRGATEWQDPDFERAIRNALILGVGLKDIGQAAAETAIRIAVDDEMGNLQRAARRLGVTDRALQMRRANRRNGRVDG